MPATMIAWGTAVPDTALDQARARDLYAGQPGLAALPARLVRTAFDASGIARRRTVLPELADAENAVTDYVDAGRILSPTTGRRNCDYTAAAPALFAAAARDALARCPGVDLTTITDVVTVSCTGFFAPGPDVLLAQELGLRADVRRTHIGFMGCHGGLIGLRTAAAAVAADPDAVVLVVAVELCTLHLRPAHDQDTILGASLFADGGAAAIVASGPHATRHGEPGHDLTGPVLELDGFETLVLPDGERDMAWTIGDAGFEMVLGAGVPRVIGAHITTAVETLLAGSGIASAAQVDRWAVHPGGRGILDRIESVLALDRTALDASRAVLAEFGNMSSATILFVLARLLEAAAVEAAGHAAREAASGPADDPSAHAALEAAGEPRSVCALAFGPGLTVESGRFTLRGGA